MKNFLELSQQYKGELLENIIPFWLNNSQDLQYGGYFTCLNRDGSIYDTDKFVWLQARQVWMFSSLYNRVEPRQEFLDCALQGASFLEKYAHDSEYNWYFSLTRDGKPLVGPYNIFSYTFAAMAFGQLHLATGNDHFGEIAQITYRKILQKADNPKGQWNKLVKGSRDLKNFSLPMIMCNLSLEMRHLVEKELFDEFMNVCLQEVMCNFYRPELGIIVENITLDGKLSDSFDGRMVNPGHAIEAMWFTMDLGKQLSRQDLIEKSVEIALSMLEYGWDKTYGGIFYYKDRKDYPMLQLEWDQKLWWVHIEALISMSKGYLLTGDERCWQWFEKIHDYTWSHFKDSDYPEWYGYLNRQGEVLLPLKGGKWKGCFHIPRGLFQCWKTLESCHTQFFSKKSLST